MSKTPAFAQYALPDTYNAVKSAESVVLLTSQQPIEDEYHITPVS